MAGLKADEREVAAVGFFSKGRGGADLAWCAVAALETVVSKEGGLGGAEIVGCAEALDGGDLGALRGDGEGKAGVDAAAIHEDGAGAALAVIATFLAAGEVEVLAEDVEEGGARVDGEGALLPVDGEGDGDCDGGAGISGSLRGSGRDSDGETSGDDAGCSDELTPGELEVGVLRWILSGGGFEFGASSHGGPRGAASNSVPIDMPQYVGCRYGCNGYAGDSWLRILSR